MHRPLLTAEARKATAPFFLPRWVAMPKIMLGTQTEEKKSAIGATVDHGDNQHRGTSLFFS